MMAKATHFAEVARGGKHFAQITIEMPLEALPDVIHGLDCDDLNTVQLDQSLEAADALRKIQDDEDAAHAALAAAQPMSTSTEKSE